MTLVIREMRDDEADAVAAMVRVLARHIGTDFVPEVTGEELRQSRDLIDIVVAEDNGQLLGVCIGLMTFSTWRGTRGLYVLDLFVEAIARGRNIGLHLLCEEARRAMRRGASFIKLEVDENNPGAERFYERLGFKKKSEDRLHILEQEHLDNLIAAGEDI